MYRTLWIPVTVVNVGAAPARNVKVTISALSDYEHVCFDRLLAPDEKANETVYDRGQLRYVERRTTTRLIVQRVRHIPPNNGSEDLVRVGFRVPSSSVASDGAYELKVRCRAQDETGVDVDQTITISVRKGEMVVATARDIVWGETLLLDEEAGGDGEI